MSYTGGVPRVTQRFRDQQVERILRAAERCFAENGFHATAIDQVVAATGMSSSTVYRYFPEGKQAIVRAVSARRMGPLFTQLRELAHAKHIPSLEEAFVVVVQGIGRLEGDDHGTDAAHFDMSARLAVGAWGERTRDPHLRGVLRDNYGAIRAELTFLAGRWIAESMIVTTLSPEDAADVIQHVAFGVIAQQAITGRSDLTAASQRLSALFCPAPPSEP